MNQGVSIDARGAEQLLGMIVAGDDVELIDASDGWSLLVELAEGALEQAIDDLAGTSGRIVAIARRDGAGVPFVMIARVAPHVREDTDDPYWETGDGD